MTTQAPVDYDVAIIGLGPVGCTAAILLAHAGLSVVAVERDEEVYRLPRAVNLDGEMVRAFQRIGLGDEIAALLQPLRDGERVGFANSNRDWLFGQTPAAFGVNGWQALNFFDQPEVEGFLRQRALEQSNVTAHIGCVATTFIQTEDRVEFSVEAIGESDAAPLQVAARYLVGCDGASSTVRRTMDSGWHNLGYDHDWLVVDVVAKPGHTLDTTTLQVCSPERLTTYVCTKDPYRRWEFKLNPGETWEEMLEPARIASLIEEWTPAGTYEVRRAAMYQFHAATADCWRRDRMFIAGDAAHQTPPFLGQGMNAGLRDVINLSWKLPLVLNGSATAALLDTYQAEREAHAVDLVEWAVAIGQLMEHLAAVEDAQRRGESPPVQAQAQGSGYGQGREAPPLRAGAFCLKQVSDTGSTGYLFAQPEVRDDSGRVFKLDELLGEGFAVVGRTAEDLRLNPASRQVLDALGARLVSLEGLAEVRGHIDRLFTEQVTGRLTDRGAAIIRPDRHVFGHTTPELPLDELVAVLARSLHLTVIRPAD